jgi:predicted enzyme related to lactoylglutathione lyase
VRGPGALQTGQSKKARQGHGLKESIMKRLHVHVAVDDLECSIGFYSALFAAQPTVIKADYAKWMLDDPRVNFAISTRGREPGLDHLGIQVENQDELHEVYSRLRKAGGNIVEQGQTTCCYAKSEKSWIDDPAGIAWETFHTMGESTDYGDGTGERVARVAHEKSCCAPKPKLAEPAAECGCSAA